MGFISDFLGGRNIPSQCQSIGGIIKMSGQVYVSDDGKIKISRDASLTILEAQGLIGQKIESIEANSNKLIIKFESGDLFFVEGMTLDEYGKKDSLDTNFLKKTHKI